ncbi:16420_t:CDS:2, partial [Racocetra persica]
MAYTGPTTEFPSLEKIDFTKVIDGIKFNGQNWPKFYRIFMKNIQSHVPKELLTTRFFTGSKYSGYQRIDNMATIVANLAADDLHREQFNIHNGQRTPPDTCTESTTGGGNPNSLKITKYFPTTLHINYRVINNTPAN